MILVVSSVYGPYIGLTCSESYYSALANLSPQGPHTDNGDDDDTLKNQSDQLSIDSVEVRI